MTYKENLIWRTQGQRQLVYDLKRKLKFAETQLDKALVDANRELTKVWGAECYRLENDIPFHEFELTILENELKELQQ